MGKDSYNCLVEKSALYSNIDPSSCSDIPRDAAKLHGEYLNLASLYASALRKFSKSGTHDEEFLQLLLGYILVY